MFIRHHWNHQFLHHVSIHKEEVTEVWPEQGFILLTFLNIKCHNFIHMYIYMLMYTYIFVYLQMKLSYMSLCISNHSYATQFFLSIWPTVSGKQEFWAALDYIPGFGGGLVPQSSNHKFPTTRWKSQIRTWYIIDFKHFSLHTFWPTNPVFDIPIVIRPSLEHYDG